MTDFALAADIDTAALAAAFAARRRVRIARFLSEPGAAMLADALAAEQRWRHVFNAGAKVYEVSRADLAAMADADRARLHGALRESARDGFQYRYDAIRVPDDAAERRASGTLLDRFALFMTSAPVVALLSAITGAEGVDLIDAQATAYRPGDVLTAHDDAVAGKGRQAAYVFGLTRDWRDEWGGLLLFHDEDGAGAYQVPRFNTLDLFAVPQPHSVSEVASFAGGERLSVTGWLRRTR